MLKAPGNPTTGGSGGGSALTFSSAAIVVPASLKEYIATVTDAAIVPSDKILVFVADQGLIGVNDNEKLDVTSLIATAGTGSFQLYMQFREPTSGSILINYMKG